MSKQLKKFMKKMDKLFVEEAIRELISEFNKSIEFVEDYYDDVDWVSYSLQVSEDIEFLTCRLYDMWELVNVDGKLVVNEVRAEDEPAYSISEAIERIETIDGVDDGLQYEAIRFDIIEKIRLAVRSLYRAIGLMPPVNDPAQLSIWEEDEK